MEPKTLGLLEIAAGILIYRSFTAKSPFKSVLHPETAFAVKAGGNAVSVLMATRGLEDLGCSQNASWGLVLGSVIAYEWLKFPSTGALPGGTFAGQAGRLSPSQSKCPPCSPPVTYTPTGMDFGPGF